MQNIIQIQIKDGIQVVDSRLVAKGLNIKHQTLIETIKKYQDKLEKLGSFTFETETRKREKGGTFMVFCYLNELQCNTGKKVLSSQNFLPENSGQYLN